MRLTLSVAAALLLAACSGTGLSGFLTADPAPVPSGTSAKLAGGTAAPDVSFKDLDDKPHKLSEFKGQPVVLALFAEWCSHCQEDLPMIQAWIDQTPGVLFLPVESSEKTTKDKVVTFVTRYNIKAKTYYGLAPADFQALGGTSYPTALLLSSEGGVVDRSIGIPPLEKWRGLLSFQ
ncbi:MAG: redoxin domain protein [Cyanobacteria bacterium RYN_339]|nr:redoxin domain protein [Cyanobacteria bacterium RYN_339]